MCKRGFGSLNANVNKWQILFMSSLESYLESLKAEFASAQSEKKWGQSSPQLTLSPRKQRSFQ